VSDLRLAGEDLGLDIRHGLAPFNLNEMKRAFRRDKLIPRSLMSPENSEPGFSLTGSYQPEVTFGL